MLLRFLRGFFRFDRMNSFNPECAGEDVEVVGLVGWSRGFFQYLGCFLAGLSLQVCAAVNVLTVFEDFVAFHCIGHIGDFEGFAFIGFWIGGLISESIRYFLTSCDGI